MGHVLAMAGKNASRIEAQIPADETERLEELYSLNLLDNTSDLRFEQYTNLVADIFEFPVVLITLVDRERQWFKSALGLDFRETSRDVSFCAHALTHHGIMIVEDAREDPRFADNPLVTGPPNIVFYAGAVVHGPSGHPLGTLCVIDHKPRAFSERECKRLRAFADLVEEEIRHTRMVDDIRKSAAHTAFADPLTALPNRRLLLDRLEKLLELADEERRQVAVLVFNVSGLRMINQGFGMHAGDELLVQLGQRLRLTCPPGGTAARLQADEFAVVFPMPADGAGHIDAVAESICSALEQPHKLGDRELFLGLRVGGSVYPQHGSTTTALIDRAAAAIRFTSDTESGAIRYLNKAESVSISERFEIESHLRGAINRQAFHLVYQPIVSLDEGMVAGVEALLRWTDAELGNVGPDRFIPIAEQANLIIPIGQWVQQEAFRQAKNWASDASLKIPVSINTAAAELLQPDFARDMLGLLRENQLSPEMIRLEVTEFSLISDSRTVDENLAELREGGIHIIIDDFGTGYSSLAYILRMPVSSVKIDRSFIKGLPDGRSEGALTRTIISMTKTLEIGTVAEGVETEQQLEFLRNAGCNYMQGYLISAPVNADQIPQFCGRILI